eukprot:snap_masked-scaffold_24-processed-gene-4.6-mRNA-1 protein AED:1.00 eAED:1.00 QI:0/-1/0/0/-1/1/1/0/64
MWWEQRRDSEEGNRASEVGRYSGFGNGQYNNVRNLGFGGQQNQKQAQRNETEWLPKRKLAMILG